MEKSPTTGYLLTKLIRPQVRRQRVTRPHLLERLDEGLHVPLSLVCAPAGYGKTILLVDWLERQSLPSSWLTLSQEESDAARFLNYLILALQQVSPDVGRSAQAVLNMPSADMIDSCLQLLINELTSLDRAMILVLDDYHWIESRVVDKILGDLIENLPPPLHLVIASRTEPSINLTRMRARAALVELRMIDLGFGEAESEFFIRQVMGLNLPSRTCHQLSQQTEGWPAALQLATLSIRHDQTSTPSAGRHHIFEYLAEEVLRRQSPDIQRFLLNTSILTQLTGPLCDALTSPFKPYPNGAACLDYLEHANLFTQSIDGEQRWYRYHALFADFLVNRLQAVDPDLVATLHQKAAHWLADHDDPYSAFQHAITCGDLELAIDLIERSAETMERHGELATLNRWLDMLPEDMVRQRPNLCLARVWLALINLDMNSGQKHLLEAEAALKQSVLEDHQKDSIQGEILAARAIITSLAGESETSIACTEQAFERFIDKQNFLYSLLKFNLGLTLLLAGKLHDGQLVLEQAIIAAQQSHTPIVELLALRQLGEGYIHLGRLSQAEESFKRLCDLVSSEWGVNSPLMAVGWLGFGEIYRQRNQLVEAEQYLEKGIAQCHNWMPVAALDGYLWLAWLKQAIGKPAEAQAVIQDARAHSHGLGYSLLDQWFVQVVNLRLNVLQGYLDEAQRWIKENNLTVDTVVGSAGRFQKQAPFFSQASAYVLARFYLEYGRREDDRQALEKAQRILLQVIPQNETNGAYGILLEGLLLLAQTEMVLGNELEAQAAIHHALEIGAPERPLRVFLDEGQPILDLLLSRRSYELTGLECSYMEELIAAFEADNYTGLEQKPSNEGLSPSNLVEPLTRREEQVLTLIDKGYSNREIASELVVSLNTVKRHVAAIMQKFGAKNRTEAARLARQKSILKQ